MPVSLYGLKDEKIVYKTWVENVRDTLSVTIPKDNIRTTGFELQPGDS